MVTQEANKIDLVEYNRIYSGIEEKAKATVDYFLENNDISGSDSAGIITSVINNIIDKSFVGVKSGYEIEHAKTTNEIGKEKLEQSRRSTPFVLDSMRIDNDIKEQKYITEQLRNGGISYDYTFYRSYIDANGDKIETDFIDDETISVEVEVIVYDDEGNTNTELQAKDFVLFRDYKRVASKTRNDGTALSTVELNNLKIAEDTEYIQTQKEQLVASVVYNNKLKVLDSLSDLWGTLGAGGLVVPTAGWTPIFSIANDLANTAMPSLTSFQSGIVSK